MKSTLIMVDNGIGLARDTRTGGIINTNVEEIHNARERKKRRINVVKMCDGFEILLI